MDYHVEEVPLTEQPAIAIRETMPLDQLPAFFGRAFTALGAYAGESGAAIAGPPFARYYSVEPAAVDAEAGFPLTKPIAGRGEIAAITLPAGRAAQVVHHGPFDAMAPAYEAIEQWLTEHGKTRSEPPREVYLSDPSSVPNPADWVTLVVQPFVA